MYGFGEAETRLGRVLCEHPRTSSRCRRRSAGWWSRVIRRASSTRGSSSGPVRSEPSSTTAGTASCDRSRRASSGSGLDRIDILFIHDPDEHWEAAISEAYPTLADLRAQGVVRAIGAGMNQAEMLTRFVREADIDVLLCAGRYTLLDQVALDELLPACVERKVSVVIGGVMNSRAPGGPEPVEPFQLRAAAARMARPRAPDQGRLRSPWRPAAGRGDPVPARPSGSRLDRGRRPHRRPPRRVSGVHAPAHSRRALDRPARRGPRPRRRPDARPTAGLRHCDRGTPADRCPSCLTRPTASPSNPILLRDWTAALVGSVGTPDDIAADVAEILVAADRRGIPSHGTARLPNYLALVAAGVMDPAARPVAEVERAALVRYDAGNGWGHHACRVAMDRAIELARDAGLGSGRPAQQQPLRHRRLVRAAGGRGRDDRDEPDQHLAARRADPGPGARCSGRTRSRWRRRPAGSGRSAWTWPPPRSRAAGSRSPRGAATRSWRAGRSMPTGGRR